MFLRTRLAVLSAVSLLVLSALPVLAAPANDDIDSPIVITEIPYTNNQDTSDATTGPTDLDCYGQGPTVWYEFTPEEDGRLEANTFGSDYDTTLLVALADGEGGYDVLACNDDAGQDVQSRIRFDAREGVAYLFMVGAWGGGPGGDLVFTLLEAPAGQAASVAISVDRQGSFHRDGYATVRGVATCSGAEYAEIEVELSQQVGRFRIAGAGWSYVECSSEGAPFEVQIWSYMGSFAGGPASAWVTAYACGEDECAYDFVETTVRLRK